jgi:hypothetical protein
MPLTPQLARDLTTDSEENRFARARRFAEALAGEVDQAFWNQTVRKEGAPGYEKYTVELNASTMDREWFDRLGEKERYGIETHLRELFTNQEWTDVRLDPKTLTAVLTA